MLRILVAGAAGAGVVALAATGGGAAGTVVTTLAPVADAYVRSDRPTTNFGKASSLHVAARPISVAYLRFRVAVPAGATVERATLRLFSPSRSATGFTVHRVVSTTWAENTLTYANVPPARLRIAGSSGAVRAGAYASVDVTSLVTRSGLVSFSVKSASGAPLSFKSRESGLDGPRLLVETSSAATTTTTTTAAARPCGTATAPPRSVDHVIWIWMENKVYDDVIGSTSAPYENELASACGLATNYHAVSHPSLPNYIAATSGSTQGIADDDPPSAHQLDVASIFSQVKAAGKTWHEYAESAPGPCQLTSSGQYAVKHDPVPYYTGLRGDCAMWDVPMGTTTSGSFLTDLAGGTLPAFSFVTPDLCSDTHNCSVATGDAWLRAWFAKILASPAYLAGTTVVFVVWDEDDGSTTNHVPLIVVNQSIRAGTQQGTSFDHYALLKTTEQLLGITTFLGHAGDFGTSSMVPAFNLG